MMIYGTDPEAHNVFVVQNGVRQEGIMAFEPNTGETIRHMRVTVSHPLFRRLLECLGFTLFPDFLVPARGALISKGDELLTNHYFMRPPFYLEYVDHS